jgi:hypothetical protein
MNGPRSTPGFCVDAPPARRRMICRVAYGQGPGTATTGSGRVAGSGVVPASIVAATSARDPELIAAS